MSYIEQCGNQYYSTARQSKYVSVKADWPDRCIFQTNVCFLFFMECFFYSVQTIPPCSKKAHNHIPLYKFQRSLCHLFLSLKTYWHYFFCVFLNDTEQKMHTPPQEYSMTAEGGALVPREWCIHSGEMVHGGRRRGAPSRHAGAYSGRALRLRMDSPSIWIVYAL